MTEALFDYRVRVSPKSRNVRIRITLAKGLEVIIPRGFSEEKVPALLERKRSWIREAFDRVESHRKLLERESAWRLPLQIELPAIGTVWHVTARETGVDGVTVRERGTDGLSIVGAVHDRQACRAALARWLVRQTHENLVPPLQELSRHLGLHYRRVYVKRQRTRWASCSSRKAIALNVKLLFLSPELVRYVMVHELCHLAEMNHSERFWSLVEKNHTGYRDHDRELREGWKRVPRWADQ